MSQTKKNFIYNAVYQIFSICIPIILAPFLSRRLGTEGSGIYSYTYSIAYYFALFTLLGMNNYGSRLIAKERDDKKQMSKYFGELYCGQLIMGVLMLLLYVLSIRFVFRKYVLIFTIQTIYVLSSLLDINWFFYGLEEFKLTVCRSFAIKVLNFIAILVLIRTKNDVWIYTLIMSSSTLLNQIILWPFIKNKICFIRLDYRRIRKHLKSLFILFIPVIAVSVYKIMDKIMIGCFSNINEVGIYEYAEKINSVPLTIIAALGTVMVPKISNLVIKKENELIVEYLRKSITFVLFVSTPIFFVFQISMKYIVPFYLGYQFYASSSLAVLLSITLPFVSVANVIRTQYLIPLEEDKIYVKSVVIGAFLNFLCNWFLIPKLGAKGACYGTIVAEISVMIYQIIKVRNQIEVSEYLKELFSMIAKALVAYTVTIPFVVLLNESMLVAVFRVIVFSFSFLLLNIIYIKDILRGMRC